MACLQINQQKKVLSHETKHQIHNSRRPCIGPRPLRAGRAHVSVIVYGPAPYAGVPDRPDQFEIEKAIGQFLFAFTPKTRALGIRPPPHALSLLVLPDNLVRLFERAFLRGSETDSPRPSGRDWFAALDFLSKNLRCCSRDPGHKYPAHLTKCPWCEILDGGVKLLH